LSPATFDRRVQKRKEDADKLLAAAIVHETIWHGIYWSLDLTKAHLHPDGFIDAADPKVGGSLSPEACRCLADKFGAD
jgi:hypothetical protein